MFNQVKKEMRTAFVFLMFFILVTGLLYPAIITLISQAFFPQKANGSLIYVNGQVVGSTLIGQSFTDAKYFWGRPSATTPFPYNALSSSGSNLGPASSTLLTTVQNRITHLQTSNTQRIFKIPVDLVTASGSGLDPDISPLSAIFQITRIAQTRNIPESVIYNLIFQHIQYRTFRILGETRVNVLALNLALDNIEVNHARKAP